MNLAEISKKSKAHIYFSSNNYYLSITFYFIDEVECFSASFSMENLLQINKQFDKFVDINNIYKELVKFTNSNLDKIYFEKLFDSTQLRIKDFFQKEEEFILSLPCCSFEKKAVYIKNNKIISTIDNFPSLKDKYFNFQNNSK